MREFKAQLLPAAAVPGYTGTWVWGYCKTWAGIAPVHLGPVVLAQRGVPVEMKFVNKLGHVADTNVLAYKYGTDQTLHWADPLGSEMNMWNHMADAAGAGTEGARELRGPIPAVRRTCTAARCRRSSTAARMPGSRATASLSGHGYYSTDGARAKNYSIYRYPNSQEGAPIWFHDHTLGATR